MCGRYYVEIDEDELREIGAEADRLANAFPGGIPGEIPLKLHGEMFPTNVVPVQTGRSRYVPMKWGFVSYDKKTIINARSETALQKPMFKKPMLENRCLIPASGYYEWKRGGGDDEAEDAGAEGTNIDGGAAGDKAAMDSGAQLSFIGADTGVAADSAGDSPKRKRAGVKKTKYRFFVPGRPIYMAGCYRQEKGSPLRTFVILTREAVNGMEAFHDRMPVIIPNDRIEEWLYDGYGAIESAVVDLSYSKAV